MTRGEGDVAEMECMDIDSMLDQGGGAMADAIKKMKEDGDLIENFAKIRMGVALYASEDAETGGVLPHSLMFMDYSSQGEEVREAVRARLEARIRAGSADAVSQFASFHLQMLDEPDYETAYIWFSISTALGLEGTLEARDDARDNVDDERLVDLQSEAGTIYESLNISLD